MRGGDPHKPPSLVPRFCVSAPSVVAYQWIDGGSTLLITPRDEDLLLGHWARPSGFVALAAGTCTLSGRAPCTGKSAGLIAADCSAFQDLYDSTGGKSIRFRITTVLTEPRTASSDSPPTPPYTRTPCSICRRFMEGL